MHSLSTWEHDGTSSDDLYAYLGIGREATTAEIKKAYHRLALTAHPDKGGDPKKFERISHAYETLSNAKMRARYDLSGQSGPLTVEQEFRAGFYATAAPDDEFAGMTVMEERRARERKRLANLPSDGLSNAEREIADVMREEAERLKRERLGGPQSPVQPAKSQAPPVVYAPPVREKTPKPTLATFLGQARPDWVGKDLETVLEKLAKVNIYDVAGLLSALRAVNGEDLNTRLRQAGKKGFAEATLQTLRKHASAA